MKYSASLVKLGTNSGNGRMQLPGQVVIPVDCVVPDMPVSMDEDSANLHHKYSAGMNPAHYSHAPMGHKNSGQMGNAYAVGHVSSEPVVDLSVPVGVQPEYMGAPFAPRHGQDIFDTWCAPIIFITPAHNLQYSTSGRCLMLVTCL